MITIRKTGKYIVFTQAIRIKMYNFSKLNEFVKKSLHCIIICQKEIEDFKRHIKTTKYQNAPDIWIKEQISF